MKILFVNHLLDPVTGGGTAERTFQLARFLTKLDMESGILTLDIGDTGPYESLLTIEKIFKLPCINQRYYIHISWPFHIRRIVEEYDVVHLMGHWTLLNAMVAMICLRLKKPYVVCPAGSLKVGGRSRFLKIVYDILLGRRLIQKASAFIAVTEDEKADFFTYGIPETLISTIPNGIDPSQYQVDESTTIPFSHIHTTIGDAPYVLFLGRLNQIKGPDLLLEAFISIATKYPDTHLVFAGPDSGMLDVLMGAANSSIASSKIHFLGYVGGKAKIDLLRHATCLVIPSRSEAMSLVVLEAGICLIPVIFTDRCGLDELAQAEAGYMVRAEASDIAQGLGHILSNPTRQRRLAKNLSVIIEHDYLWMIQAHKCRDIFQRLS